LSEFIETNTTSRFIAAQMAEALGQAGRLGLAVIEDEELWATAELLRIKGELVRMLGISESSAAAENQFRRPWHGNDDRPKVRRGQPDFTLLRPQPATAPSLRLEMPSASIGDEVALKVERVMDGSVHVEKALGGGSRLEPLHFTLSSSHHLMGVLGTIVRSQPLLMRAGQAKVPESSAVRAQLVSGQ
jgi:hypothetical protein